MSCPLFVINGKSENGKSFDNWPAECIRYLNKAVICPLVAHIEGGRYGTSVGVLTAGMKDVLKGKLAPVRDLVLYIYVHV